MWKSLNFGFIFSFHSPNFLGIGVVIVVTVTLCSMSSFPLLLFFSVFRAHEVQFDPLPHSSVTTVITVVTPHFLWVDWEELTQLL